VRACFYQNIFCARASLRAEIITAAAALIMCLVLKKAAADKYFPLSE